MSPIYADFGFDSLAEWMRTHGLEKWADLLPSQVEEGLSHARFGDLKHWLESLNSMPVPADIEFLPGPTVTANCAKITEQDSTSLMESLEGLIPWRKGPYDLCGINIDTEWRSDWKWDRLSDHIQDLSGRLVLDVGCGNGYHMWRMLGAGAERVIGVDPSPRFSVQFEMVKRLAGKTLPVDLVPVPLESVPRPLTAFDTAFSMGVIYHRRDHMAHLVELKDCLRPGGELVLESLVIQGDDQDCLIPQGRYAKMRNVWAVPSAGMLAKWLRQAGFTNVRLIDESTTSIEEQRSTDWMRFESLPDYLDPNDQSRTVEGHPAPRRAILIGNKPA